MNVWIATFACLAAWWAVLAIWSVRSRRKAEQIVLTPEEVEDVRAMEARTPHWDGWQPFIRDIFKSFVAEVPRQPRLLFKAPVLLVIYLAIMTLFWPCFLAYRGYRAAP
jgi:hypothetical protein